MRRKPYLGITGFKTKEEINKVAEQHEKFGSKTHVPMFGYLCSKKRLDNPNIEGKQSPNINNLVNLVNQTPDNILPMIHYFTKNKNALAEEVEQVFTKNNLYNFCQALQINMDWPDPKQIAEIQADFIRMQIVLQLPQATLEDLTRIEEYKEYADYCLIDPSGGFGKEVSQKYIELIPELHEKLPRTRIGIAGGLNGENIKEKTKQIQRIYKEPFSIDAQGRLRTNGKIDFQRTEQYIRNFSRALNLHYL